MQCKRCGKENPAEIHTCTPYFHMVKKTVSAKDLDSIKKTDGVERVEYMTEITKVIAYKLDNILYTDEGI